MDFDKALESITLQERHLQFKRFDEEQAWTIGSRLRATSLDRHHPVVIHIRQFDRLLFYATMPGSTADNFEWARRKSNVVERFHKSSYAVGLELTKSKSTLESRYGIGPCDYAAHGGSFPVRVSGVGVIGSITVSGLPQKADHELVVEILCQVLEKDFIDFQVP